jgi:L-lactate dehydrogenase complex protein LldF
MIANESLKDRVHASLGDEFLRKAVRFTVERLRKGKALSASKLGRWEEWRERGEAVRRHAIANLDYYLAEFVKNARAKGTQVHFAADGEEAIALALEIARKRHAKLVAKSKSMVSEELHFNQRFAAQGIECVETDLGEWIVQLAGEIPSHIILPAIHKNRAQIRELFEKDGAQGLSLETSDLAGYARKRLREMFLKADIGMSGCNFAVAETGSVALFTNEGNGRMVTTLPGTHLVLMGMERIVPSLADLELMANLLPRSATGQKLTTYLSVMQGPRQAGELDGPEEVHVIILDNGRSRQLGDPEFQDLLNCIRCGACLNVCPVYAQVGGHAYNSPYSGPIGAVLTPRLQEDKASAELANASSLCGACTEACPVRIPLHDMLVHLRRKNVEAGFAPKVEGLAFGGFGWVFGKAWRYRTVFSLARLGERLAPWASKLMPGMQAWSRHRVAPKPAKQSFREWWREEEEAKRG